MKIINKIKYTRLNSLKPNYELIVIQDDIIHKIKYYKAMPNTKTNLNKWGYSPQVQWLYSSQEYLDIVEQGKDLDAEIYESVPYTLTTSETDYILGYAWANDIEGDDILTIIKEINKLGLNIIKENE